MTLPGIIDEPGSFAGSESSCNPHLGPEPSHLMSLAIFIRLTANVFSAPLAATIASCAANCENLFGAETNGRLVFNAIADATRFANSGWVFNPVPTAVPPNANSCKSSKANSTLRMSASN